MAATPTRTLVPKSMPPPEPPPEFDREAILERLFALPLPAALSNGSFPVHTPLGRIMRLKKLTVRDVDAMPDCPNYRYLSNYLAARKPINAKHRAALARALGVDPRLL